MLNHGVGARAICASLAFTSIVAWAAPADDVRALMEKGQAAQAYDLGKKHPESLGEPTFDFYFGIAAIDTGRAGEGVLALERYILTYPDNASARLQLARGYFALNEDARAREEFESVQRLNPPADVRATITRFLDAIRLRETRYTVSGGVYIEAGIGVDSNVNGGVQNAAIFLPNLGPVIIDNRGTRKSDRFTQIAAGGYISYPVAPGVALFGGAAGDRKMHVDEDQFDLANYSLTGGVSLLQEKHLLRFSATANSIDVDNERYRKSLGGGVEWQYQLDQLQAFNVGAQYARLRYAGTNSPRDADFNGLSAGYRRLLTHKWQPVIGAGLSVGKEDVLATGRDDLARDIRGARVNLSFTPAGKWGIAIGASIQKSTYKAPDAFLGVARKDDYRALEASVTYLYDRNLSFRAEVTSSRNDSNIQLYEFPRDIYALKARYEFK